MTYLTHKKFNFFKSVCTGGESNPGLNPDIELGFPWNPTFYITQFLWVIHKFIKIHDFFMIIMLIHKQISKLNIYY